MSEIFKYKKNQPIVWFDKRLDRSNQYCLYCGTYVGKGSGVESNKEHLIAREFVPNHCLKSTDFNFIFRCCVSCNTKKSSIERHLSTTTLFNSDSRIQNIKINELALNKASKDYHPNHKGKLVADSSIQQQIEFVGSGIKLKIGFVAPPQSNEEYVVELAYRQIQGLFTLVTSSNPLRAETTCLLPFDSFHLLGMYPKNDWGNRQIEYAIKKTEGWFCCCNISIADGYFKAILLKSNQSQEGWFWALEWNKSVRILGAIITKESLSSVYEEMLEERWSPWLKDAKGEFRFRAETPLVGKDHLFRENSE